MKIKYPLEKDKLNQIKAGDVIEYTGVLYTSRDAAHMRIEEMLKKVKLYRLIILTNLFITQVQHLQNLKKVLDLLDQQLHQEWINFVS